MTTMYVQMYYLPRHLTIRVLVSAFGEILLYLHPIMYMYIPFPSLAPPPPLFLSLFPSVLGGRVLYVCERVEEGGGVAQSCGLSAGAVLPIF